eukprot:11686412-Ditylum_brightwellii.AAC.1
MGEVEVDHYYTDNILFNSFTKPLEGTREISVIPESVMHSYVGRKIGSSKVLSPRRMENLK